VSRLFIDLSGQQFDRLTVIEFAGRNKWNQPMWKCRCECTNERTVCGNDLRSGNTRSCGCLAKEVRKTQVGSAHPNFKHGQSHRQQGKPSPIYYSWRAMITRCTDPEQPSFKYYGERGITVCDRWQGEQGFENFLADMGERPQRTTLDRKKVNGNYEPSNCRWASAAVQDHNRRKMENTFSQFRGVHKNREKFKAVISINRKRMHLGTFDFEIDAAKAYNEAALKHYGEFACLNEIPEPIAA
jgi:AP2 domain